MNDTPKTDLILIGVSHIDDQHKQLIGLSNALIQAMINGMGREVLEDILSELRDFARTHFEDEEAYMREINYPGYEEQCARHRQLAADVDEFGDRVLRGEMVAPADVLRFINDWIIQHIIDMDSKIGAFVRSQAES